MKSVRVRAEVTLMAVGPSAMEELDERWPEWRDRIQILDVHAVRFTRSRTVEEFESSVIERVETLKWLKHSIGLTLAAGIEPAVAVEVVEV